MSQRATSCCLYKHSSQAIDVSNNQTTQFTFILLFIINFIFSSFHKLDLVSATSTPWVAVVLAYLLSRHRLIRGEAPTSSADGAPYCHRNRQNWTIQFAKSDSPIFSVLNRRFRLLSDSYGSTFWRFH
jgi:hypothetical protein